MFGPPLDPRTRPSRTPPTWRGILAGYVLIAAVPVSLVLVSRPVIVAAALGTVVAVLGLRRVARVAGRVSRRREVSVDLAGEVRITVSRVNGDETK